MKVLNIHRRMIGQPKEAIMALLETLGTKNDLVWPLEKWPAMRLDQGLKVGSRGGHGPIQYTIDHYVPGELIRFEFSRPKGFHGCHRFEFSETGPDKTMLTHTIEMHTSGTGTIKWLFAIRWLHDALIEDAFDKIENHFSLDTKETKWNSWVKLLRYVLK